MTLYSIPQQMLDHHIRKSGDLCITHTHTYTLSIDITMYTTAVSQLSYLQQLHFISNQIPKHRALFCTRFAVIMH